MTPILYRTILWIAVGAAMLSCAGSPDPDRRRLQKQALRIVETDERLVQRCEYLGAVRQGTDIDTVFDSVDTERNIQEVKIQAARLGATHIVWLYRYKTSAAATAYRCGGQ